MKIESSIHINRPVTEVFDFIMDYSRHHEWSGAVRVDLLTDGPPGVGTKVNYVGKFLGRELATESVITVFEPPHRMGYRIEMSGMNADALQTFEEENGGTRMTWAYDGNFSGLMSLFKFAEGIFKQQSNKQMKEALENLKRVLEQQPIRS